MIDTFVDAFIYEPTITDQTTSINTNHSTYIYDPPKNVLHPYLKSFNNNNNINNIMEPTTLDTKCYDSHRSVSCIGIGLPLRD
jgi:hypothetical protein